MASDSAAWLRGSNLASSRNTIRRGAGTGDLLSAAAKICAPRSANGEARNRNLGAPRTACMGLAEICTRSGYQFYGLYPLWRRENFTIGFDRSNVGAARRYPALRAGVGGRGSGARERLKQRP